MRRLAVLLALAASPAQAWEFAPVPICTLTQPTEKGSVTVTYDPSTALYSISLALTAPGEVWPVADSFSITFLGARGLQIGTDRHVLSDDNTTLTVTDSGFGNVLDGLQFNAVAQAQSGDQEMVMSLTDAAEPVAAFRDCGDLQLS